MSKLGMNEKFVIKPGFQLQCFRILTKRPANFAAQLVLSNTSRTFCQLSYTAGVAQMAEHIASIPKDPALNTISSIKFVCITNSFIQILKFLFCFKKQIEGIKIWR